MSFNNAGYVPPPPAPRRARSPWMFVGIGCGTLALLFVVTVAIVANKFVGTMREEMKKPLNITETKKAMGDVPEYQNATLDETMTKAQRATTSILKMSLQASDVALLAYRTEDKPDRVIDWYADQMEKRGYKEASNFNTAGVAQGQYRKGSEAVMVQCQPDKAHEGDAYIIVMHFTGVKAPAK